MTAVETYAQQGDGQVTGELGGELPPSGGVRIARVCPEGTCGWRKFGDPEATCPKHHKGTDQQNGRYFGKQTAFMVRAPKRAKRKAPPKKKAAGS